MPATSKQHSRTIPHPKLENDLDHKFKRLRQRVGELQRRATEGPAQQEMLQDTFEELLATMEELKVTEEQLYQQNDELVAARQAVESERQRYQDLFESAPSGYLVTDPGELSTRPITLRSRLLEEPARG